MTLKIWNFEILKTWPFENLYSKNQKISKTLNFKNSSFNFWKFILNHCRPLCQKLSVQMVNFVRSISSGASSFQILLAPRNQLIGSCQWPHLRFAWLPTFWLVENWNLFQSFVSTVLACSTSLWSRLLETSSLPRSVSTKMILCQCLFWQKWFYAEVCFDKRHSMPRSVLTKMTPCQGLFWQKKILCQGLFRQMSFYAEVCFDKSDFMPGSDSIKKILCPGLFF